MAYIRGVEVLYTYCRDHAFTILSASYMLLEMSQLDVTLE